MDSAGCTAVLVPLLVLVVVEASLRIAGVGFRTSLLVPRTVKGVPASGYNLFSATQYFPAGMVQTPRLYSIPRMSAPGPYRIFVLGESAAPAWDGYPMFLPDGTQVQRELQKAVRRRRAGIRGGCRHIPGLPLASGREF